MQYMLLIYVPPRETEPTPEQWAAEAAPYEAYGDRLRAAGAFVDAAPLAPITSATTVRVRDARRLVTDGPFADTKEWLGGYYVVEAPTLDVAIAYAADCPGAAFGSVEIRPLVDLG